MQRRTVWLGVVVMCLLTWGVGLWLLLFSVQRLL